MTAKAHLIGINDYAPAGDGGPDLSGCVNDIEDFATVLSERGVVGMKAKTMRVLTDTRATKEKDLTGLVWLFRDAKPGDVRAFYYSGHGTYLTDTSGDEPYGRDEAICPHNFPTAGMICDDEIGAVLSGILPGVRVEVFLDTCFSGTTTRQTTGPCTWTRPRTISPPLDTRFLAEELSVKRPVFSGCNPEVTIGTAGGTSRPASGTSPGDRALTRQTVTVPAMTHVIWSGCSSKQTSEERQIDGTPRGVFTYHLCQVLRDAPQDAPRKNIRKGVCAAIRQDGYRQTPQLEGPADRLNGLIFG
ncbi:MAG: caspase family protein [Methanomicrobiales archaeon]|nr:caspase family protein [Methanomicrobiales archaeon]